MKAITLGAAPLNQPPMDWEDNAARMRDALAKAPRTPGVHPVPAGAGFPFLTGGFARELSDWHQAIEKGEHP